MSASKKLALKALINNYNLDVLLLQETLGARVEVTKSLLKILPGWHFQALDVKGRSGGLATGVKEGRLKILTLWGLDQALGVEVYSLELCSNLLILNIYGPCHNRVSYWNNLLSKSY